MKRKSVVATSLANAGASDYAGNIGQWTWFVSNLHVSLTDYQVIREIWKRMLPEAKRSREWRMARKVIYGAALERHHENQALVRYWRL